MAVTLRTALNRVREQLQQDEYWRGRAVATITPQNSIQVKLPGLDTFWMLSHDRFVTRMNNLLWDLGYSGRALNAEVYLFTSRGDE